MSQPRAGAMSPRADADFRYNNTAYSQNQPFSNGNQPSSVAGMMRQVPVQQCFNGPAATFVNVFQQPGTYDVNVHFPQLAQFGSMANGVPRYSPPGSQNSRARQQHNGYSQSYSHSQP